LIRPFLLVSAIKNDIIKKRSYFCFYFFKFMPLFEKAKQLSQSSPSSPRPGPVPPKFNPSSGPISIPRRPLSTVKKTITPAKTLFEEKKDWTRADFLRKTSKAPLKTYSSYERKKMLNEALPSRRFSTYISEGETKTRLRELRREEYRAKTYAEKSKLGGMRKYLEKQTGLKGKY